uniref:Protein KTI12 homolog n=1 Tax=Periophthalmus magnuspinnatus TaxID=409849 RepID=A0A3B4BI96_9GOBI
MPLLIMCGFPCSGKTQRTKQLKLYLEQNCERKIHVVGDEALGLDRNSVYENSQKEKDARGALKAEVERKVNKDDVVILDSLNYIKGYRYELFCLIKHTQTPHCLVIIIIIIVIKIKNIGRNWIIHIHYVLYIYKKDLSIHKLSIFHEYTVRAVQFNINIHIVQRKKKKDRKNKKNTHNIFRF